MATKKASKRTAKKRTTKRAAKKTGKKVAKRAAKKTGKKVAKKVAKKTSELGREGTVSHFFRQQIVETKKDRAAVLRDARARFPDSDIPDNYYAWYRRDCKKRDLIA